MPAIRKTTAVKMALNVSRKPADTASMVATKQEAMKSTWKSMMRRLTKQLPL